MRSTRDLKMNNPKLSKGEFVGLLMFKEDEYNDIALGINNVPEHLKENSERLLPILKKTILDRIVPKGHRTQFTISKGVMSNSWCSSLAKYFGVIKSTRFKQWCLSFVLVLSNFDIFIKFNPANPIKAFKKFLSHNRRFCDIDMAMVVF